MSTLLIALVLAAGVLALSACAQDELAAPRIEYRPTFAIMGDLPTSNLLEVSALRYVPGQGIELDVYLNHGLLEATQKGEAAFALTTRLVVRNLLGQTRAISPKSDPLVLLKTIGSDGELDLVRTLVPWNGLDAARNPMTGETQLEYLVEIGTGDGIMMAARTGVTTLVIE